VLLWRKLKHSEEAASQFIGVHIYIYRSMESMLCHRLLIQADMHCLDRGGPYENGRERSSTNGLLIAGLESLDVLKCLSSTPNIKKHRVTLSLSAPTSNAKYQPEFPRKWKTIEGSRGLF